MSHPPDRMISVAALWPTLLEKVNRGGKTPVTHGGQDRCKQHDQKMRVRVPTLPDPVLWEQKEY